MRGTATMIATLLTLFLSTYSSTAEAGASEARQALRELRDGRRPYDKVQNRFFLKSNRFELAPVLGIVPNNPMVERYTGGILAAYHFSESFAAEGAFIYSPDLGINDLKGLTNTLVQIAEEGSGNVGFQQPLDKMVLGATFAARWAPVYGKINLLGEKVVNFDFYGIAGLGLQSIASYYAQYESTQGTVLAPNGLKSKVSVNAGLGFNFFINQSVSLKIDARSYLYSDFKPDYDPNPGTQETEKRLYNNLITSAGVSVFFPKMKPRLMDF